MTNAGIMVAFARRDWTIARSYRLNYVVGFAGSLTQLALYFFLGRLFDRAGASAAANVTDGYFAYAVVGIAVLGFGTSVMSAFSASIRMEQMTGSLEAVFASPNSPVVIVLAAASYGVIQATISTVTFVTLAITVFGLRPSPGFLSGAAAGIAFVGSVALFAALGIAAAAMTLAFKQTGHLFGIVATVLGILSGVYFPIDVLPEPLHTLARLSPLTWGLDAVRGGLFRGETPGRELALLALVAALAFAVSLRIFVAAVRHARKRGTLALY